MSFTNTSSEETAILKNVGLYTGIRVTFECTGAAGVFANTSNSILDCISALTMDVPDYGARSRRIDIDSNTKWLLPVMCQLSSVGNADAVAATSTGATTATDAVTGFAYFDLPVNKVNTTEDTRITITAVTGDAAETLNVSFTFLYHPMRSLYYRAYNVPASQASWQQWFPSDGLLRGFGIFQTDGAATGGSWMSARRSTQDTTSDGINQITLDGEQESTWVNASVQGLSAGLDQVISGEGGSWLAVDAYALLQGFPVGSVGDARYVQYDRQGTDANSTLILGVMSDA